MKKNPLLILTLIASMTLSPIAMAQDYNPDPGEEDLSSASLPQLPPIPQPGKNEQPVGTAISPMKKGQTAPFTGLLLSPEAIAQIIVDIQTKEADIQIEVQRATDELNAEHEHDMTVARIRNESDNKLSQSRIDAQKKEIDRLDVELKKEKDDRPSPIVWTAIGVAAGVLVSTLTASAIVYAAKQ